MTCSAPGWEQWGKSTTISQLKGQLPRERYQHELTHPLSVLLALSLSYRLGVEAERLLNEWVFLDLDCIFHCRSERWVSGFIEVLLNDVCLQQQTFFFSQKFKTNASLSYFLIPLNISWCLILRQMPPGFSLGPLSTIVNIVIDGET